MGRLLTLPLFEKEVSCIKITLLAADPKRITADQIKHPRDGVVPSGNPQAILAAVLQRSGDSQIAAGYGAASRRSRMKS